MMDRSRRRIVLAGALISVLTLAGCDSPSVSEPEAIGTLRKELPAEVERSGFSGAVVLTRSGQVLFSGAYGKEDRDTDVANTLETKFRMGSMNKMFTGVATLQLVQAGKIELDAPLVTYLPEYPNQELAKKVTIHQLLTHTAGTGNIFGPQFDAHRTELRTIDDYLALYGQRALEFEPGARFVYSNYGYMLLGAVIQRASGQDYYDYVREHILTPAGMHSTGSLPEDQTVEHRAVGYTRRADDGKSVPNTDTLPYRGTPAGGGYSTLGDLVRFAEALLAHRLLNAEYTEMLIKGKVNMHPGRYAYGFGDTRQRDGRGWVGHNGGAPGMAGDLRIYPRSGYVFVLLANVDPSSTEGIVALVDEQVSKVERHKGRAVK